jgi:hypothetical protein
MARGRTPAPTTPEDPADKGRLDRSERRLLAFVGTVLMVVGLALWVFPAKHQQAAPESAKCTDANSCWVEVEDAPEILLSSFVVLGAVFVLVGLNGRRLTKFAGPGVSFESEGARAAQNTAEEVHKSQDIPDDQKGVASTIAAEKARWAAINAAIAKQAPLNASELVQIQNDAIGATMASMR